MFVCALAAAVFAKFNFPNGISSKASEPPNIISPAIFEVVSFISNLTAGVVVPIPKPTLSIVDATVPSIVVVTNPLAPVSVTITELFN